MNAEHWVTYWFIMWMEIYLKKICWVVSYLNFLWIFFFFFRIYICKIASLSGCSVMDKCQNALTQEDLKATVMGWWELRCHPLPFDRDHKHHKLSWSVLLSPGLILVIKANSDINMIMHLKQNRYIVIYLHFTYLLSMYNVHSDTNLVYFLLPKKWTLSKGASNLSLN